MDFKDRIESAMASALTSADTMIDGEMRLRAGVSVIRRLLDRVAALPSVGHVSAVTIGTVYHKDSLAEVRLYLAPEYAESPLIRELVREFGVKAEKAPHWDQTSLQATFIVDGIEFMVNGYKPSTCRIVETEEEVPATKRIVRRIVCDDEEEVA
jgi:hypothetical protein